MFGNGLSHVWPFAAVARHFFGGFPARYAPAVATSEKGIAALQSRARFEVTALKTAGSKRSRQSTMNNLAPLGE